MSRDTSALSCLESRLRHCTVGHPLTSACKISGSLRRHCGKRRRNRERVVKILSANFKFQTSNWRVIFRRCKVQITRDVLLGCYLQVNQVNIFVHSSFSEMGGYKGKILFKILYNCYISVIKYFEAFLRLKAFLTFYHDCAIIMSQIMQLKL